MILRDLYDRYCLPCLIDLACGSPAIARHRREVVPLAAGRVLEVGMGSGLNLPFYDRHRVERIYALEPSSAMRRRARKNVERSDLVVEWLALPAGEIPLEDRSVDTVLLTFTLCSIADWQGALSEMRRVLKPSGRLLFCEHGAAPDEGIHRWQRRLTPGWSRIAGGCRLDRPIPELIEQGGFDITRMESRYLPGVPRIAGFTYWGEAVRPPGEDRP